VAVMLACPVAHVHRGGQPHSQRCLRHHWPRPYTDNLRTEAHSQAFDGIRMMRIRVCLIVLTLMWTRTLSAQSLGGEWQGTLVDPPGQHRVLLHVEKAGGSGWKATAAFIDDAPDWGMAPESFDSVTLTGRSVKLVVTATPVS
jgi:hypothetical protein